MKIKKISREIKDGKKKKICSNASSERNSTHCVYSTVAFSLCHPINRAAGMSKILVGTSQFRWA